MHIDPALLSNIDNYKLLTNLVVPRPIAWVFKQTIKRTAEQAGCSIAQVKRIWAIHNATQGLER